MGAEKRGHQRQRHILTFIYRAFDGYQMVRTPPYFNDTSKSDFFFFPANWACARRILTAPKDKMLHPYDPCPRSEVVLYLWRAAGKPTSSIANPFTDVSPTDEYYQAVLWAKDTGITQGAGSDTIFKPNGTCTRAEVVTFLMRYVNWRDRQESL